MATHTTISKMALFKTSILTTICSLLLFPSLSHSYPLSTSSRWIVDDNNGNRVKLSCVNWPGHLHAMIPEGLNKSPLNDIVSNISFMGFNCVRLTWATYMYTRRSANNAVPTVSQSLSQWNLTDPLEGVKKMNPEILEMNVWDVQQKIVNALGAKGIMVILDNHVSNPQWCCGLEDGNGFFGDQYFDPNEWVKGLTIVARRYKLNPTVVAMSMRNELRGPRENTDDWYKYMQRGGAAIHKENPNVLVFFSGLKFDTDLSFLRNQPLTDNLHNKLVVEAHWYAFGQPEDQWVHQTNEYCANVTKAFMDNNGFLFTSDQNPIPLFLSEFGADQTGANEVDNRYFNCILGTLAEYDMDWALWHLAGSFMLRNGQLDVDDVYAMFDHSWANLRNKTFLEKLKPIQFKFLDPKLGTATLYKIYHPQTGKCIDISSEAVVATSCQDAKLTVYNNKNGSSSSGSIRSNDTDQLCLTAIGRGLPPSAVTGNPSGPNSLWTISKSRNQLAAKDEKGNNLCLDWDSGNSQVVTNSCLCLDNNLNDVSRCNDNPQTQWFKLVHAHY